MHNKITEKFMGVEISFPNIAINSLGTTYAYPFHVRESEDSSIPSPRLFIVNNMQKGTLRGLHGQIFSNDEHKFVRCTSGSIFEVFVDCRKNSETFGSVGMLNLNSESKAFLHLPPGFLHGYQTLTDNTELQYFLFGDYIEDENFRVNPVDENLAIEWPLEITQISPADKLADSFLALVNLIKKEH
jgi:dTDP-4-dehydrorhamnose 3,5-epimerase